MDQDHDDPDVQCDNEAGDGIIACMNDGGVSVTESFVQQRKINLMKAAQERERRSIRETHLRRETFKIIESLVEGRTDEEYLIKCASLLCQFDWDNVHEERSLAFFCGYPLCDNRLSQPTSKQRKQMFKIDYRNRQLYKMEEIQLFCSVLCYKSSYYLREQMSPEPLWMRYTDLGGYDELYRKGFETLKLAHFRKEEKSDLENNEAFKQPNQKVEITMKESVSFPYIKQEHLEHLRKSINNLTIKEKNVNQSDEEKHISNSEEDRRLIEEKVEDKKQVSDHDHGIGTREEEKEGDRNFLPISKIDTETDQKSTTKLAENQVYERLKELMTFDSFIFIFGSSIIDELIQLQRLKINDADLKNQQNQAEKELISKRNMESDIQKLCKKLDDEEILDKLIFETEQHGEKKMKAEFKRKLVDQDQCNPKQSKGQSGGPKKVTFNPEVSVTLTDSNPVVPHVLPQTSHKSQNRLRKQLFLRQLDRTLTIQKISAEISALVCPLFRELIDTFKFTSSNVVIANEHWPELLLFVLKILDERSKKNQDIDSNVAIMDERSVVNLCQKIYSENSSYKRFEEKVSSLLECRNFFK